MPPLVKLCVLGSSGVGKTSLVQQLIDNHFEAGHRPTKPTGDAYHLSAIINSNLYQIKIIDMPTISYFPTNTFMEWTDYRQCALRNAHGYLIVFDLTSPGSFHYVKVIRDQLFESRNMQNIPVWIVGNKADLCMNVLATMRGHRDHHHHHHHVHLHHHSAHDDLTPAFKELANLVKKQWKCSYIECSAKYNWRVVPIFRDIIKTIDNTMISESSGRAEHHHSGHHRSEVSAGDTEPIKLTISDGHSSGAPRHATQAGHHSGGRPSGSGAHNTLNATSNESVRLCVIL